MCVTSRQCASIFVLVPAADILSIQFVSALLDDVFHAVHSAAGDTVF